MSCVSLHIIISQTWQIIVLYWVLLVIAAITSLAQIKHLCHPLCGFSTVGIVISWYPVFVWLNNQLLCVYSTGYPEWSRDIMVVTVPQPQFSPCDLQIPNLSTKITKLSLLGAHCVAWRICAKMKKLITVIFTYNHV